MITLTMNNFGCGSITLKDYQSAAICVLNGKITVDPTHPDYMAATRLELDLPADFAMPKSAMSTAILVSNVPICLLYTSPSPRDRTRSRMPSSA